MSEAMEVDVVAPDGMVWQGEATSVIVRTTEGDIGILYNHEPVMAALVPCAAEVVTTSGQRKVIAVGGGFISVFRNRVSVLSDTATLAEDISLKSAEQEWASMKQLQDAGQLDDDGKRRYYQLEAQVKAGERFEQLNGHGVS